MDTANVDIEALISQVSQLKRKIQLLEQDLRQIQNRFKSC